MKFYFHPRATDEFEEAVRYYEDRQPGLGMMFAEEIFNAIKRVMAYPDAWSPVSENIRYCLANRFPYRLIYRIKHNAIQIIAVANLHRKPEYWRDRQ